MQNRTYLVSMPSNAGTMPLLDILVQGPVGSPTAPVAVGGATAAPAGWGTDPALGFLATSDGAFYELRSRTFRCPVLFGQNGFVPRLRLGWIIAVNPALLGDGCSGSPMVRLSFTLAGNLTVAPFSSLTEADPSYGSVQSPVIRLINTPDVQGGMFVVNFSAFEAKDEDRIPSGV